MLDVRTIAVINQKGGVGKTTTVVNLGAAVASRGHDVCLIDMDPQSQLTLHLSVEADDNCGDKSIYDVLTGGATLTEATVKARPHLWVVPSVIDLAAAEMELVGTVGREQILKDRLAAESMPYEYVLIDCPPSLGLLTLNALAAADELLIPLQAHFLALQGLGRLLETVSLVQQRINPNLRVSGVVLCMFEKNTRLANEVVADLAKFFTAARDTDVPWAQARIFQSPIRRNVKLAECPSFGTTIFDYEPTAHGADDYNALADEFLLYCPGVLFQQPSSVFEEPSPEMETIGLDSQAEPEDKLSSLPAETEIASSMDLPTEQDRPGQQTTYTPVIADEIECDKLPAEEAAPQPPYHTRQS